MNCFQKLNFCFISRLALTVIKQKNKNKPKNNPELTFNHFYMYVPMSYLYYYLLTEYIS